MSDDQGAAPDIVEAYHRLLENLRLNADFFPRDRDAAYEQVGLDTSADALETTAKARHNHRYAMRVHGWAPARERAAAVTTPASEGRTGRPFTDNGLRQCRIAPYPARGHLPRLNERDGPTPRINNASELPRER